MCGGHGGRGRRRAWSTRRIRQPHAGAGRVDRLRASRRTKARGLGQRWPRTGGFGEALHDLFPVPGGGVPERDLTVEIDPFERSGCRIALRPPRICQVLLRRVRDAARSQEEGESTPLDDNGVQRLEELAALVEHVSMLHAIRVARSCLRDFLPVDCRALVEARPSQPVPARTQPGG
jgi:hypothetical protein